MMISGTFRCLYLLFRCIQCILLSASLFVLTVLGLYLFGFVFVFYFSIAPWFTFFFHFLHIGYQQYIGWQNYIPNTGF